MNRFMLPLFVIFVAFIVVYGFPSDGFIANSTIADEMVYVHRRTQVCVGGGSCGSGMHCCGDGTKDWCCAQSAGCTIDGCR